MRDIGIKLIELIFENSSEWFPEAQREASAKNIREELFKSSIQIPESYNGVYTMKVSLPTYG